MVAASSKEEVLKIVNDMDISFIRLWFTDIVGQVKSLAVTKDKLEDVMENGLGFDGSSVTGYQDIEESDMIAMPDPSTFRIVPWRPKDRPVARMICDVMSPDGQHYEGDPRYVLKQAIKRAKQAGFDDFLVGPELEYFYFKDEKNPEPMDSGGYFDLTDHDFVSDVRRDTILALKEMGISVELSHHECGPSQHEIDVHYGEALEMADNVITYKIIVKKIARKYDMYASFMPKPMFGEAGSGMHIHQSLFKNGHNSFFDKDAENFLSDTARKFVAGQLKHAREMSSIFAQWINSYKRLVPGYEAPVYIAWSMRNRSALIRVPLYHPGQENATRCEIRSPDPACNPYLTFAVLLHAGLDGIEKGYQLEQPMEKNLYHLTPAQRKEYGINSLPDNLGEAISVTENSELVRKALGDHVFNRFIELKKNEWNDYRVQVTEYEINKLLPIL
ncbi:MAG TPA: glutamine synthetase family protein [bacterium]|nr:glutamine synthetase family protein [bacterium]